MMFQVLKSVPPTWQTQMTFLAAQGHCNHLGSKATVEVLSFSLLFHLSKK